jgi:hypothetical protein
MDPFGRASSERVEAVGTAAAAAGDLSRARSELAQAQAEIAAAEAQAQRSGFYARQQLELEIEMRRKMLAPLQQQVENTRLLAEATGLEAEAAKRKLDAVPLVADAQTKEIARTRSQIEATIALTDAEKERLRVMMALAQLRAEGVSSLAAIAPDRFRAQGARAAGLAEIPGGGLPVAGDIIRPGDASFADAMPKMVQQLNLGRAALDSFRDSATSAFAALVDGSKSAGEAFRSLLADFLSGMAMKLFTYGLELAVQLRIAESLAAFAGAAVVGGFARKVGGEGVSGGSGSGAYAGASSGPKTTYTTILVGDSFTGSSPRQNASKLKRYLRMGEERTS